MVKPVTYRPFAEFCLDVYDALCRRGWRRLGTRDQPGSPPSGCCGELPLRRLEIAGLKPLPSKRRTRISDLAEAYAALRSLIPFTTNRPPNHDQLQAIVGGLPGLALEERNTAGARIVGTPLAAKTATARRLHRAARAQLRPVNTARLTSLRFLD